MAGRMMSLKLQFRMANRTSCYLDTSFKRNGIDYRRANSSLPGLDPSRLKSHFMPQFTVPNSFIPVGHEIIQIDLKLNETTQEWESETTSCTRSWNTFPIAIHPQSGEIYYATFDKMDN